MCSVTLDEKSGCVKCALRLHCTESTVKSNTLLPLFMSDFKLKITILSIVLSLSTLLATPANFTEFSSVATLISPANQSLNVGIPVELQWGGTSGSVDVEVVNCTVDANVEFGTVNLDEYELVSGPTVIYSIPDDLSGVTYNPLTNTLFMVANGNTTIYETNLSGGVLRTIFLSGFDDTEGIVHISGTRYAVSEERRGRITFFDITTSTSTVLYGNSDYVQLPGTWNNNQGLEGVSYDPAIGEVLTVKEKTPKGFYSFPTPVSYPTVLSSVNTPCNMTLNPFGFGDIAGLHYLGLTSGFDQLSVSDHTLLLSHESLALVETDENCNEISRISLNTGGGNGTLINAIPQPEGITMDDNGTLYIVSEPNQLFIFENPNLNLNPIDIQSTVHTASTTDNSYTIPAGVLQENTEYCWRVNDGTGWTDYWSFTTASSFPNVPPEVDITSPTSGTTYNAPGTIQIQASATDFDGTITDVEFYIDGSLLGSGQLANGSFEINYTLTNGTHTITAVVTDNNGAQTTSSPVSITANIPNNCPTVQITSPSDGLIIGSAAALSINASASDSDGTVTQVEFFVNGQSIGVDVTPTFSVPYNFNQDGLYEVVAVATDDSACSSSDLIYVQVGPNQLPVISVTQPLNNDVLTSFQTLVIQTNTNDPDGTITKVEFFVNGSFVGEDIGAPYQMPYDFNQLGTYDIVAIATDNAGDTGTSTTVTVTVDIDNFMPDVMMTSPANNTTFTPFDMIELSADAEDPDGDIQHVEFFINGVSYEIDDEFPYLVYWQPPGAGTYVIKAIATDADGGQSVVDEVTITVEFGQQFNVNSTISSGNDDLEEIDSGGEMYFNSSDLEIGTDNNRGEQTLGLRFTGMNIPQGAMIIDAYIQFRADESDTDATSAVIEGEATDNAAAFPTTAYNLTNRSATNSAVLWTIPAWTTGDKGVAQRTPQMRTIIQEIIGRSGYTSSSAIVIKIDGTGQRVAESREGNLPNDAPQLVVAYTLDSCPQAGLPCDDGDGTTTDDVTNGNCGCAGQPTAINSSVIEVPILTGNDDAEERGTNGGVDLSSSDLELTYDRNSTGNQVIGLRFDNIFLAPGTLIDSAFVQFTVDETPNNSGTLEIYGEDDGDSQPFINVPYDISSRSKTSASALWNPPTWNSVGVATDAQRTPDIKGIIQEIVSGTSWDGLGKPITILIEGTGKRVAESYEGSEEASAKLIVYYQPTNIIDNTNGQPNNTSGVRMPTSLAVQAANNNDAADFRTIQDKGHSVDVFPNPATDRINVNVEFEDNKIQEGIVTLMNIQGQFIRQKTFNPAFQDNVEFDVKSLPQGVYMLQIEAGKHKVISEFIKK